MTPRVASIAFCALWACDVSAPAPSPTAAPVPAATPAINTSAAVEAPKQTTNSKSDPERPRWSVHNADVVLPFGPPRGRFERQGDEIVGWTTDAPVGLRLTKDGQLYADPGAIGLGEPGGWRVGCLGDEDACEPTLHRVRGGVEEAWSLLDDRLWHRYVVSHLPSAGISLELALTGASAVEEGGDIAIEGVGTRLRYADVRAWDATGTALPATLASSGDSVIVQVDTANAKAPISIDPWLMPATEVLPFEGWRWGNNFRAAGDVNGDSWPDLVISQGNTDIYYCDGSGIPPTRSFRITGSEPWPQRRPVEVTGDGVGDIMHTFCGSGVYLYPGQVNADPFLGPQVPQPYPSTWHGCNDEAADVDGDGFQDLVMAESNSLYYDSFVVYKGGPTLTSWQQLAAPTFEDAYPYALGWPHVTTGDVNGDGFADVLMTAPQGLATDPAYQGSNWYSRAWLYYGGPTGMQPDAAWVLSDWYAAISEQPFWADIIEDVNGDGYDEVVFGGMESTAWWVPGGPVAPGAPRQLGAYETMCQEPDACAQRYAVGISGIGDVNGDGYNDIGLETGTGGAVLLGSPDGPIEPPYVMLDVAPHGNLVVANKVGDLNGDGYDELALGAPFNNRWPDAPGYPNNSVFIWYGEHIADIDQDGTPNDEDCHPYVVSAHPGAPEIPGTKWDEDCDGTFICYAGVDADGDGAIGDVTITLPFNPAGCEAAGAHSAAPDCDDSDDQVGPFATELPDTQVDEDCDGRSLCRADLDGDGYGSFGAVLLDVTACAASPAWDTDGLDCDDARADVNPAATDLGGSAVDEDCDGLARCFTDSDGDGYGGMYPDAWSWDGSCAHPGMGERDDDCDDAAAAIFPGASVVVSDDIDDNCDGFFECFEDYDLDYWGGVYVYATPNACGQDFLIRNVVQHTATRGGDCNPNRGDIYPGAPEIGWNEDMNCDGLETCTIDADGDHHWAIWGPATYAPNCQAIPGYGGNDCNDADPRIYPSTLPQPPGPEDLNCDGIWNCYVDADADGYGGTRTDTIRTACDLTPGFAGTGGDCADRDSSRSPGVTEVVGDRVDQDCDNRLACWGDADQDGWGSTRIVVRNVASCAAPASGLASETGDCDDLTTSTHPGLLDRGADGVDADCDGADGLVLAIDDSTRTLAASVHGAGAGTRVTLVVSTVGAGAGPCPAALAGACAGLRSPRVVMTITANDRGVATAHIPVPPQVPPGAHTAWQAWVVGPTPAEGSSVVFATVR